METSWTRNSKRGTLGINPKGKTRIRSRQDTESKNRNLGNIQNRTGNYEFTQYTSRIRETERSFNTLPGGGGCPWEAEVKYHQQSFEESDLIVWSSVIQCYSNPGAPGSDTIMGANGQAQDNSIWSWLWCQPFVSISNGPPCIKLSPINLKGQHVILHLTSSGRCFPQLMIGVVY